MSLRLVASSVLATDERRRVRQEEPLAIGFHRKEAANDDASAARRAAVAAPCGVVVNALSR